MSKKYFNIATIMILIVIILLIFVTLIKNNNIDLNEVILMSLGMAETSLAISIGTLAALVYNMRILVNLDRKISKIMKHQGISES